MTNGITKIFIYFVSVVVVALGAYLVFSRQNSSSQTAGINNKVETSTNIIRPVALSANPASATERQKKALAEPIAGALERISKKPFGLKVSPGNSPVSPEKFSGYHTGVDFETMPAEQDIAVPVYAVCPGELLLKKMASGYGGVAVQSCELEGEKVTVIYGHLKLSSIGAKIKAELRAGEQLGILGKGYSTETAGERKHLHLGIHRGTAINILGYVQNATALKDWLDAAKLL